MKIKKHNWLKWQEEYLKKNYSATKVEKLAAHLKLPQKIVKRKCDNLGLIRNTRWSKEDKAYLATHYHNTPMELLVKHLKRDAAKIRSIANKMKITGKRYGLDKPKPVKPIEKPLSQKEKSLQRWDRKVFPVTPFNSEGKRAVRVDRKTFVYVPVNATDIQIQNIISRYKKTA